MLSKNKIFFALFLLVLLSELLAPALVKPMDELMLMLFLLVIALDLLVNGDIKRYKSLFVLEGIFLFYFIFIYRRLNNISAFRQFYVSDKSLCVSKENPYII